MEHIHTDSAPAALGPYSQAIRVGNMLYLSGQIAIDPSKGKITATAIKEQAEQCCRNIGAVLTEAGTNFTSVVKTTCFLRDMGDFAEFNIVYGHYFTGKPARSCVAVNDLPAGALCEIEAVAVIGE